MDEPVVLKMSKRNLELIKAVLPGIANHMCENTLTSGDIEKFTRISQTFLKLDSDNIYFSVGVELNNLHKQLCALKLDESSANFNPNRKVAIELS